MVSLLRNHIVLMFLYAVGTALFFALRGKSERAKFNFVSIFCGLFFGGIALGWLMFVVQK